MTVSARFLPIEFLGNLLRCLGVSWELLGKKIVEE